MTRCEAQAGLLAPQPCGNSAVGECARCGRGLCEAHATLAEAGLLCRSCQLGVGAGLDPLTVLGTGAGLAALFTAADLAAFDAAAVTEEPDDMTADLS